jgi:hypothetical protein
VESKIFDHPDEMATLSGRTDDLSSHTEIHLRGFFELHCKTQNHTSRVCLYKDLLRRHANFGGDSIVPPQILLICKASLLVMLVIPQLNLSIVPASGRKEFRSQSHKILPLRGSASLR